MAIDECALECDLAEVYHIYDYESLSPLKIATFSVGLRENSRIKMKISGSKQPLETMLMASAVDILALLLWSKSKDAEHGRNKPESIVTKLMDEGPDREYEVFDSPEAFEEALRKIEGREV